MGGSLTFLACWLEIAQAQRLADVTKKYSNKVCTYCRGVSSTGDHVFARTFVPSSFRAYLPQVPACGNCNARKSLLETYLTTVLPLGGNHPAAEEMVRNHLGRRLTRNVKLQKELNDGFDRHIAVSPEGMHATAFRGDVLSDLAEMIGKGLLFHHTGVVLDSEHMARGTSIDASGQEAHDHLMVVASQLGQCIFDERLAGDAVIYRGFVSATDPQVSSWQIRLYQGLNLAFTQGRATTGRMDLCAQTVGRDFAEASNI